ncbi:hypothetical protein SAMN05660649_02304 [Desulfotomaculum arcticum]|uniref:DUF6305 domain-containing protein n=1 Tax=Desulfotruncus arcticus DSM 17038 TaxID=1121424 RepID=A0A1I2TS43_9FIRM|nr:DUF6305 family protein [Desulfotruncus arcticus]SFG65276.1 hypothetical protein SAMN05660649_02304 [Desulfotomaculum arcticum] [Desulfotruncus arcticus DSM 17038]
MRKLILPSLLLITISIALFLPGPAPQCGGEAAWTLPHLPYPIAKKRVLVTSAGQSTDGLIVAEMLKELNISHSFRREATGEDLTQWYESLVLVLGYSDTGLKKVGMSLDDEIKRVQGLVSAAQQKGGAVIVVHLGGKNRRNSKDDILINEFATQANYLVVVKESDFDGLFSSIAAERGTPYTVAPNILYLKPPLNSAFR